MNPPDYDALSPPDDLAALREPRPRDPVSPSLRQLNANVRRQWLQHAQDIAFRETADSSAAIASAMQSRDPAAMATAIHKCRQSIDTLYRLYDATREPVWLQLAASWEHLAVTAEQQNPAVHEAPLLDPDGGPATREASDAATLRQENAQRDFERQLTRALSTSSSLVSASVPNRFQPPPSLP